MIHWAHQCRPNWFSDIYIIIARAADRTSVLERVASERLATHPGPRPKNYYQILLGLLKKNLNEIVSASMHLL